MAETTIAPQQAAAEQAAQTQHQRGRRDNGRGQGPRGRRPEMAPEEKQFDERVIHIDRVARVVKGGRRFRFRALVVVGDRKNRVGVGTAKGADVTAAVTKATEVAKKHFVAVPIHNGTIPHDVEAKVSGARILIMPAAVGTGLIAGGVVRTVLEVAGISNALSKSLGSTNKTNAAYATIAALQAMVPADDWVTKKHRAKPVKADKKPATPTAEPKAADKPQPAPAKPAAKVDAKKASTKKGEA